jgi:metal-sulfur cluster biosynthetic enzyme
VAESLPVDVHNAMAGIPGIKSVKVDLTWDPPFTMDRMADHVKLQLGLL